MTYICARCGGLLLRFGLDSEIRCVMCGRRPGEQPLRVEPVKEVHAHRNPYDVATDPDGRDAWAAAEAKRGKQKKKYATYKRRGLDRESAAAKVGISKRHAYRWEKE